LSKFVRKLFKNHLLNNSVKMEGRELDLYELKTVTEVDRAISYLRSEQENNPGVIMGVAERYVDGNFSYDLMSLESYKKRKVGSASYKVFFLLDDYLDLKRRIIREQNAPPSYPKPFVRPSDLKYDDLKKVVEDLRGYGDLGDSREKLGVALVEQRPNCFTYEYIVSGVFERDEKWCSLYKPLSDLEKLLETKKDLAA